MEWASRDRPSRPFLLMSRTRPPGCPHGQVGNAFVVIVTLLPDGPVQKCVQALLVPRPVAEISQDASNPRRHRQGSSINPKLGEPVGECHQPGYVAHRKNPRTERGGCALIWADETGFACEFPPVGGQSQFHPQPALDGHAAVPPLENPDVFSP